MVDVKILSNLKILKVVKELFQEISRFPAVQRFHSDNGSFFNFRKETNFRVRGDAYSDVGDNFFGRKPVSPCTVDQGMQFSVLNMPNELA